MAFTFVTVTGTVLDPLGNPAAGMYIQFSLTSTLTSSDNGTIVTPGPQSALIGADGTFSISLPATDDATTFPKGQVYQVQVQVPSPVPSALQSVGSYFPTYYVSLPAADAPTVNLSHLIGNTANPTDSGWVIIGSGGSAPGWQHGWAGGGTVSAIRRIGTVVYVQLAATGGTSNTAVFTLPAGWAPTSIADPDVGLLFPGSDAATGLAAVATVTTTGNVLIGLNVGATGAAFGFSFPL